MHTTAPAAVNLELTLAPEALVAAWRPSARTLTVAVPDPVERGQRIQARIRVRGMGVAATITGRATSTRLHPVGLEVDIEPDALRLRAVERLVAIAAGERVEYRPRAPRLLASVPAVVEGLSGPKLMSTFSVSTDGCGLAWSGPMPDIGAPIDIRLGAGALVASFCGEVCWTAPSGSAPTVGVQFAAGDHRTWERILSELQRSGSPLA